MLSYKNVIQWKFLMDSAQEGMAEGGPEFRFEYR